MPAAFLHLSPIAAGNMIEYGRRVWAEDRGCAGRYPSLDHDYFGSNRSKIMSVIGSNILERDAGGKPLQTFPHPALELGAESQRKVVGLGLPFKAERGCVVEAEHGAVTDTGVEAETDRDIISGEGVNVQRIG